jgi:LmbE family N-acetylglucosaminyl deacetylase
MHRRTFARLLPVLFALSIDMASRPALAAGPPAQPNAAQIALGLQKLGVAGRVLYVAAHPDDENTALLAYLANGIHVRTAYLSLTRGDGGQNLIGSEQGPALGLIRTQELLAARHIDGAEQFFTRARDFGFSKNPEETLRIWGKDAVLADVVAVIRKFRPDVIITRFSPEPSETHGHHTASAMLALEAFHAAADPKFHPEQLSADVTPWQARRIFWNRSSFFIKPTDDLSGDVKLDVNEYNALLGESYGEMAADSRSMHKSQGFGVARNRAPIVEYFHLLASADPKEMAAKKPLPSIFSGIEIGLRRFPGMAAVGRLIEQARAKLDVAAPYKVVPVLVRIYLALNELEDNDWRSQKMEDASALIAGAAGLFFEATASEYRAAPGTALTVTATAINRSPLPVKVVMLHFPFQSPEPKLQLLEPPDGPGGAVKTHEVTGHLTLAPLNAPERAGGAAKALEVRTTVTLPSRLPPTTPYWLQAPPGPGLYQAEPALIGLPEQPSPLEAVFSFLIEGREFLFTRPVSYKWTDPVMGERYRSVEVTPAVSVSPSTHVLIFRGAAPETLEVRLTAGAASVSGVLRPEVPPGWGVEPTTVPFTLGAMGSETTFTFRVHPAAGAASGALHVVADVGDAHLSKGVVRIEHPHIPIQTYLVDADVRLEPIDLKLGGAKIGYLPGPGDEVPAALRRVGYDVTLLGDEALAAGVAALQRFDAVVVGVRAFNTSERLRAAHPVLMAYVQGGGTLVVQYNTNNRLAPLTAPLGPWPFEIGQKRVTDETAPVTFAIPGHPALTTPNAIGPRDFAGWIQERGLYFADQHDQRYEAPLRMNDPGEPAQAGGLLWARFGKGTFVYTGLAFFRQLPAGVPGAYRLFANLLAGGHAAAK